MTQPTTGLLSLVEWLRKQSEEAKQHAKSRREDAEANRKATPEEHRAAKKMAEQMSGRKLTGVKIDKKSIAEHIRIQERIADKLESEARQLDAWADAVERMKQEHDTLLREKHEVTSSFPVANGHPWIDWALTHMQTLRNAICATIPQGEDYGDKALETWPAKLKARLDNADAVYRSATDLCAAMETCHDCKGQVVIQEHPVYCEDGCDSNCECHDGPECTPIYVLHAALAKLLRVKPTTDSACGCPRTCDCQNPEPATGCALISNECPVHNDNPRISEECNASEHWDGRHYVRR